MFKNKKILMVGKETYTYPFLFLAEKWKEENTLAMLWINPIESKYEECDVNSSTYYAFKKLDYVKNYTLNSAADIYTENLKNPKVDYEYLKYIDDNYTHFKTINVQLISDQKMTGHYHYRTMCVPVTYEQQLYWIQLEYQAIEQVIEEFQPDVILDCDIAELARTVLNEIAFKKNIPYISICYPRYEMYKIPGYSLSVCVDDYFREEYRKCMTEPLDEEIAYVESFRERKSIKNPMYIGVNNPTYTYTVEPLINTLKSIYGRTIYFIKQDKSRVNRALKKKNSILYDGSLKYMQFWTHCQIFRRKLMKSNSYFENPIEGEPYVYMPLHLIPESTTFSVAPFWINELSVIEAVSKALPTGWRLYVKEHQAMLGERGKDFYERVKKIPNVRLVRFNFYNDPKPWIEKAKAVVTITGTSAFEAALLGKPAFVFGEVPFALIKGITRVTNIEELPRLLNTVKNVDNIREAAAYIRAVKNVGYPINLAYIMNSAYDNLNSEAVLDKKFYDELEELRIFFEKSYERVAR